MHDTHLEILRAAALEVLPAADHIHLLVEKDAMGHFVLYRRVERWIHTLDLDPRAMEPPMQEEALRRVKAWVAETAPGKEG